MRCRPYIQRGLAIPLAVLGLHTVASLGSKAAFDTASPSLPNLCESRTINYITHTLPQQCLRTSWTGPASTTTPEAGSTGTTTPSHTPEATPVNETQQTNETEGGDKEDGDLATSSFMSFEEWKEMMLRKSGQDPAKLKDRKPHEQKGDRDSSMGNGESDSIGEEGEISLDFDTLSEKVSELASSSGDSTPQASATVEEQVLYDDGRTQYYRSKDAGKTCKERFSYASFDAGATILKYSQGAKNAKAILVENKDTYMLLECRSKNKFVIVELSDDILVDTVVIANFEFFSSMIRKFRVSVSDRYPVKIDKWVELGTFEARNSRDIQPFLVEHPQIYTKYIRIEFLTHYGNEYYCPVSLLRVHGTRMLDTWKEQDNSQDDDVEHIDASSQKATVDSNETQVPPDNASFSTAIETHSQEAHVTEMGLSPWQPMFYYNFTEETCVLWSPTTGDPTPVSPNDDVDQQPAAGHDNAAQPPSYVTVAAEPTQPGASPSAATPSRQAASPSQSSGASAHSAPAQQVASTNGNNSTGNSPNARHSAARGDAYSEHSSPPPRNGGGTTATSTTATSRNRNSTSSSATPASPTVQESFFKTVTKRLQILESNTSLSLQYIEEQSRFLQDALLKMEKKQAGRVDTFLDNLNKTVLAELRSLRTQYDQIWQSTVIALETQREQSQREIVALSGRVAVLADEVVFQKRMAILQSVLLLSCLVLVIFSRGGGGPVSSSSYGSFGVSFGSPSPFHVRQNSSPPPVSGGRQHQLYRSDKVLPMTPTSPFSREGTPLIHIDRTEARFYGDSSPSSSPELTRRRNRTMSDCVGEDDQESGFSVVIGESTESPQREDLRHASRDEFGGIVTIDEGSVKSLSKGRSSLCQLGGVRKPLPALPEDPS